MYDDLIKRLRDFAVELRKAEDALLVRDAADAIEELNTFKRQITDGRFYVYKLGTLFELRNDPRELIVRYQSLKEPPKED